MPDDPNLPSPPPWESGRHTWFDPPRPRTAPEDPSDLPPRRRFRAAFGVAPASPAAGHGAPPPALPADPRLPPPARPMPSGPPPAVARASVPPPLRPPHPPAPRSGHYGPSAEPGPVAGQAPPPAVAVQWSPQPAGRPVPPAGPVAPHPVAHPAPASGEAHPAPVPRGDGAGWAWVLLLAALVFLASAGWFAYQRSQNSTGDPGRYAAPGAAAPTSAATWPACAEVFVPGRVIREEQALAPCRDPDGGLKAVGNFRCSDGRRLFQVDANTGAPAGWGFGGAAYRETADAASDPDYAAAYRTCTA